MRIEIEVHGERFYIASMEAGSSRQLRNKIVSWSPDEPVGSVTLGEKEAIDWLRTSNDPLAVAASIYLQSLAMYNSNMVIFVHWG
jgi:hypothetical protein